MADDSTLLAERRRSWTNYWASGALHSCLGSFDGNYAGEVPEAWRGALAALPAGATVLDLCTGNGALPALFLGEPAGAALARIHAVDLAQIRPDWVHQLEPGQRERVAFQGGIQAESLPFEDASFDLVCSQFGIEYTDLGRSLPEVVRVLKPGGLFAVVLHDTNSLMCSNAREERTHLAWMAEHNPIARAAELCRFVARAATPEGRQALAADPAAEKARLALNEVMAAMTLRAQEHVVPDVLVQSQRTIFEAIQAAMRTGHADAGLQALGWLREQLLQSDLRLAELLGCALDEAALDGLLAGTGLVEEARRPLAFPGGDRLGWWLQARKPA